MGGGKIRMNNSEYLLNYLLLHHILHTTYYILCTILVVLIIHPYLWLGDLVRRRVLPVRVRVKVRVRLDEERNFILLPGWGRQDYRDGFPLRSTAPSLHLPCPSSFSQGLFVKRELLFTSLHFTSLHF